MSTASCIAIGLPLLDDSYRYDKICRYITQDYTHQSMPEPFTKTEAQQLARGLIARRAYRFSVTHAEPAMIADEITHKEVLNAIDLGNVHKAALQADGTFSYKFTRRDIGTAITFKLVGTTPSVFVIRTAWRTRRHHH